MEVNLYEYIWPNIFLVEVSMFKGNYGILILTNCSMLSFSSTYKNDHILKFLIGIRITQSCITVMANLTLQNYAILM